MSMQPTALACSLLLVSVAGCSYQRAYVSYTEYEKEDIQAAATGWDGQRLGRVAANEGGALWERCTDVAEGSMWVLMDDARRMGGNAIGEIRWVPQDPKRTTDQPTCKKKWGWFLVWPVLATPGFMSARVEAVAYNVPDLSAAAAGVHVIPDDELERAALARRLVDDALNR
jgi:hypothetical protein